MTLLCVVAHPDDETVLCGGALALLAAAGVAVHVVCLTRGEGGELGEPPLTDRAGLGELREAEMVCAVGALGARSLTFLGYTDPTVAADGALAAPVHDPVLLTGQLVNAIKHIQAQVVLTHGSNGEYGHPAHVLVHHVTRAAVAALGAEAPALWTFAAHYPGHPYERLANRDDLADLVVDVRAVLDQKERAALCHRSQNALFVRRRSEAAGRPLSVREILLTEESFHCVQPTADDPLRGWLRPAP